VLVKGAYYDTDTTVEVGLGLRAVIGIEVLVFGFQCWTLGFGTGVRGLKFGVTWFGVRGFRFGFQPVSLQSARGFLAQQYAGCSLQHSGCDWR